MASTAQEAPRLYVSAPSDLDLRPLLDGLKRRGTQPYVLSDVALIISLEELLRRMESASFAQVVRMERNRSVHGPGPS